MIKKANPKPISELITTCDIETDRNGNLLDIGLYHNKDYWEFDSWYSLLYHLKNNIQFCNVTTIWAHHGGGFDWVNLFCHIYYDWNSSHSKLRILLESPPTASMTNGLILEMIIHLKGRKPIRFRDSHRLLPVGLDKALKSFALSDKYTLPAWAISDMGRFKATNQSKYYSYLRQDVIGLYELLTKFRTIVNDISPIGDLPVSLGALAMRVFKTSFISDDLEIITPTPEESDFARMAYQGGRTEYIGCGITDENKVYHGCNYYDRNSSFPFEMYNGVYPTWKGVWTDKFHGAAVPGVYLVSYHQRYGHIPIIRPMAEGQDKRSPHYLFSGRAYVTTEEICALLAVNSKIVIYKGFVYPMGNKAFFREFVETLYNLRMSARIDGNTALDYTAKLIMNNLYGKFGQRGEAESLICLTVEQALEKALSGDNLKLYAELVDAEINPYVLTEERAVSHGHPLIAAMITAKARIHLTKLLERHWRHVIYCDTDSIILQEDRLDDNILSPNTLGLWKAEHLDVSTRIWGKKGYEIMGEHPVLRQKGVPSKSIPPNLGQVLAQDERLKLAFKSPTLLRSALKRHIENPSQFLNYYRTIQEDKSSRESGLIRETC